MAILFTGKALLQLFIFLFVVLSGVWIHLGFSDDPYTLLGTSVLFSLPEIMGLPVGFLIIPFAVALVAIVVSFYLSRSLGIIGVFFALLAGYFITGWWGILYAFIALMLAFAGPLMNPYSYD